MTGEHLFLVFLDRETALAVAAALIGRDVVEGFDPDGWLENGYWNIDDIGVLTKTTGEGEDAVTEVLPGYHVNGIWSHPTEPVPEALERFRIYPETPLRVFG